MVGNVVKGIRDLTYGMFMHEFYFMSHYKRIFLNE